MASPGSSSHARCISYITAKSPCYAAAVWPNLRPLALPSSCRSACLSNRKHQIYYSPRRTREVGFSSSFMDSPTATPYRIVELYGLCPEMVGERVLVRHARVSSVRRMGKMFYKLITLFIKRSFNIYLFFCGYGNMKCILFFF